MISCLLRRIFFQTSTIVKIDLGTTKKNKTILYLPALKLPLNHDNLMLLS
jgi:hypothetical protein